MNNVRHEYLSGDSYFYKKGNIQGKKGLIEDIVKNLPINDRDIDPVGIIEIVLKGYLLDDRTLLKNIKYAPWLQSEKDFNKNEMINLPKHNTLKDDPKKISKNLKEKLINEMFNYVKEKNTVGILLSGGLDSRIGAGILKELQITDKFQGDVVAMTWGLENCRDVEYAKIIAKDYNWEWQHYQNDIEQLKNNFILASKMGACISPIHYHSINKVNNYENIDIVLACSYGDHVGRGEFSGTSLINLKKLLPKNINKYNVLNRFLVKELYEEVFNDAYDYRRSISDRNNIQYREIEQEKHYMYRKLQYIFNSAEGDYKYRQLFTDRETYSYMWSIDASIRTDLIYYELLKLLPGNIDKIPWARTGKTLDEKIQDNKSLLKNHHKYGTMLRGELRGYILDLIQEENIINSGLFNVRVLEHLMKIWPKAKTDSINYIDELFSWMASLSLFVKSNDINLKQNIEEDNNLINSFNGIIHSSLYINVRNFKRK